MSGESAQLEGADLGWQIMRALGGETHGRLRILGVLDAPKFVVVETNTGTRTATRIGPMLAATTMRLGRAQKLLVEGTTIGTTTATTTGPPVAAATMPLKEALRRTITSGAADHGISQVGLHISWTGRTSRSR